MTQDDKTPVPIDDPTIPEVQNSQGAESLDEPDSDVSAHGTAHPDVLFWKPGTPPMVVHLRSYQGMKP